MKLLSDTNVIERISYRIDHLSKLNDGWYWNGEGDKLLGKSLILSRDILSKLAVDLELPYPGIFPTIDGSIQAEYEMGSLRIEIQFQRIDGYMKLSILNMLTHEDQEFIIKDYETLVSKLVIRKVLNT